MVEENMDKESMKLRTKVFARQIIMLCRQLPESREGRLIGNQLFRAGTSVGANYRAACRARSRADFISKLSIVLEEADESELWAEVADDRKWGKTEMRSWLINESRELRAIFSKAVMTARSNEPRR